MKFCIKLGLQLDDPRAQSPRRRHLHLRGVREDLQAPGQSEAAQVIFLIS